MKPTVAIIKNANKIVFGFMILMLLILASATFIEKIKGTDFVHTFIYGSWGFILLWFIIALGVLACLLKEKMQKQTVIFLLHLSFLLILSGAFLTFTTSTQGRLHLRTGETANTFIDKKNNTEHKLPFDIVLSDFQVIYYQGTQAPSDYVSTFKIRFEDKEISGQVSMNTVFSQSGFRFYQSGYDRDGQGSILLVKSDRYGLTVTYLGYFLLLAAMTAYFFSKNTKFRSLLKHPALKQAVFSAIFLSMTVLSVAESKNTVPENVSKKMGELQILHRNRICPLETFAQEFTLKIYGKSTYKSLSSEQVLSGWIFYPEEWKNEDFIKIKNENLRKILGITGKYASFYDFFTEGKHYKLTKPLIQIRSGENIESAKDILAADEKIQLLFMLQTGILLKIFPMEQRQNLSWYSSADELPDNLSENEQLLIRGYFEILTEYALEKNWEAMEMTLDKLKLFQKKSGGNLLPSSQKMKAEHLYNKINSTKSIALSSIFIGIFALVYSFSRRGKTALNFRAVPFLLNIIMIASGLFVFLQICLRGYIIGRIPLGNGFETMQLLAICIIFFAFFFQRKSAFALPFGFLFFGLVLFVSNMGASNPQITQLQPVLLSPLLSIHVSLIMMAYTLFGFITFNSIVSFLYVIFGKSKRSIKNKSRILQLYALSRVFLYPAVFLFTAGIIVGAVWAELSWGRYWSWDAKETWAFITLIIYALPLHPKSFLRLEKPFFFHIYMILAFLSVLMTYFGVNYFLGGLHSYA